MAKLVEYDSKMNTLSFGKFREKELDLFFSICYKLKNEGVNEITLTFQELKELSNYSRNDIKRFTKDLESTYTKLLDVKFEVILSPGVRDKFVLFTSYRIDETQKEIKIRLNQDYSFVLNDIEKFTKFDLMEFASLKSAYAKNVFRLLKQFDNKDSKECWYQVKLDDFKVMLDIPIGYKMINIDQRVLSPILEQLKPYFNGLKLEKIKKGVRIDSLKFTWKARKKQKRIEEIKIVKRKKVLGEKELREHENIIQEREQENKIIDQVQNKKVDKIKITNEEYKQLYLKHCKEHNIEPNNKVVKLAFDQANLKKYEVIEQKKRKIRPKKTMILGTEISQNLLLSAKGKKLFGIARKNKIEKILEQMARRKAIRNFKYNYKYMVIEGIFGSGKSENIESNLQELKKTLTKEQLKKLEEYLKNI